MGLVDYSESDSSGSEAEAPNKTPVPAASASSKKPFQKVVDRSNPGKIVVNLPQASAAGRVDEPPAKRARTGGGGPFSGFNSFLPPPKNVGKAAIKASGALPRPGVNLRTSAAPGFSRDGGDDADGGEIGTTTTMSLPPPKQAEPSIPEGQKSAEEVKLVGKPLMFRPLSVARNSNKKKKTGASKAVSSGASSSQTGLNGEPTPATEAQLAATALARAPKKVSLFSMHTEEESDPTPSTSSGTYEPLFETGQQPQDTYAQYAEQYQEGPTPSTGPGADSLDTIADDLNLSAAARRELFGRSGSKQSVGMAAKRVVNFNMDREYQHNEELRASGEQQIHNPVRAIQGGGKHSLQKLVQNVRNQRDAYEDTFAQGKNSRKEASGRYGW